MFVGFALAASYPRRVFHPAEWASGDGKTLADAGLAGRQEALFVEMVERATEGAEPPPAAAEETAMVVE